jgi:hypothetical protein
MPSRRIHAAVIAACGALLISAPSEGVIHNSSRGCATPCTWNLVHVLEAVLKRATEVRLDLASLLGSRAARDHARAAGCGMLPFDS